MGTKHSRSIEEWDKANIKDTKEKANMAMGLNILYANDCRVMKSLFNS